MKHTERSKPNTGVILAKDAKLPSACYYWKANKHTYTNRHKSVRAQLEHTTIKHSRKITTAVTIREK